MPSYRNSRAKGSRWNSIQERLCFTQESSDALAEFQLNVIAAFAQPERAITKERQAEGIAAAKKRGVYKGRAKALTLDQIVGNTRERPCWP